MFAAIEDLESGGARSLPCYHGSLLYFGCIQHALGYGDVERSDLLSVEHRNVAEADAGHPGDVPDWGLVCSLDSVGHSLGRRMMTHWVQSLHC